MSRGMFFLTLLTVVVCTSTALHHRTEDDFIGEKSELEELKLMIESMKNEQSKMQRQLDDYEQRFENIEVKMDSQLSKDQVIFNA